MNKSVKIAMDITADYRYVYDPEHDSKPGGMWKRTNSGWSSNDGDIQHDSLVSQPKNPASTPSAPKPSSSEPKKESESFSLSKPEEDTSVTQGEKKDAEPVEKEPEETTPVEEAPKEDASEGETEDLDVPNEGEDENGDSDSEDGSLFDDEDSDGFSTDDEGKQEEQEENGESEEDAGEFADENKDKYLDPDKYDEYIEKMNSFIEKFDEGEGKENDVTFKAIASNLDWDKVEDVKAFSEHCAKKELEGADEVLAFLYFMHQDNEEKFDGIVDDMK